MRERERERERDTEREREIDGSDVTLVTLKLAKKFALFLAKTLKLAKSFALFLAKNLHLSFSPLISLKWREFTLSVAKNVALLETVRILHKIRTLPAIVLPLSYGVTGDRSTETSD